MPRFWMLCATSSRISSSKPLRSDRRVGDGGWVAIRSRLPAHANCGYTHLHTYTPTHVCAYMHAYQCVCGSVFYVGMEVCVSLSYCAYACRNVAGHSHAHLYIWMYQDHTNAEWHDVNAFTMLCQTRYLCRYRHTKDMEGTPRATRATMRFGFAHSRADPSREVWTARGRNHAAELTTPSLNANSSQQESPK